MKKVGLTLSVICALSLQAQTISLEGGKWSLIGIQEKPYTSNGWSPSDLKSKYPEIELIIGANGRYGEGGRADTLSTMRPGEGFWIKTTKDVNITFDGDSNYDFTSLLGVGWKLITFKKQLILDKDSFQSFKQELAMQGYYITLIIGANGRYGEGGRADTLSNIDPNAGYWVKVQKQIKEAQKEIHGKIIDVKIMSDKEVSGDSISINIDNNGQISISGLDSTITGSVIVNQIDPNTGKITQLKDVAFGKTATLNVNVSSNIQTGTASKAFYVYGVEEGGAPLILSNAVVYKKSGNDWEEIGTTNAFGYFSGDNLNNGEYKISAEGYADYYFSVDDNDDTYYIVLTKKNVEVSQVDVNDVDDENSTGTSGRILQALGDVRYAIRNNGVSYIINYDEFFANVGLDKPEYVFGKHPVYFDKLQDDSNYKTFEANSTLTPILTVKSITLKYSTNGITYAKAFENDEKMLYSKILDTNTTDVDKIYLAFDKDYEIGTNTADDIYNSVVSDPKNNKLLLYVWENGDWQYKGEIATKKSTDKPYIYEKRSKVIIKFPDSVVGTDDSAIIKGYQPFTIVYSQPANHTAEINVTVTDENGNIIKDAAVEFGGITYPTENGKITLKVTKYGENPLVYISAFEPNYVRGAATFDLSQNPKGGDVNISLEKIPDSAIIQGQVIDKDTFEGVQEAKVKIIKPITLDIAKQIEDQGKKAVEVGLDPSATYTWYIKEIPESKGQALARVATDAWIKVKEAKGSKGNKLYFYEILKQLQSPKHSDDNTTGFNVTSDIFGNFEIAVKVAHDVDNDGTTDYTEFAVGNEYDEVDEGNNALKPGDKDKNYGVSIGSVKIAINENELIKSSSKPHAYSRYAVFKNGDMREIYSVKTGDNPEIVPLSDDKDNLYFGLNEDEFKQSGYLDADTLLTGGNNVKSFTVKGIPSNIKDIDWQLAITANLEDDNGNVYGTVYLAKNDDGSYGWKLLDINLSYEDPVTYEDVSINSLDKLSNYGLPEYFTKLNKALTFNLGKYSEGVTRISYKRALNIISSNKIITPVMMTMQQIADSVGLGVNLGNRGEKKALEDGFNIVLAAKVSKTEDIGDKQVEVDWMFTTEGLGIKTNNPASLISVSDAKFSAISQIPHEDSIESDKGDRAGYFVFPRVPYNFAENPNNPEESLLRLKAYRYDYNAKTVQIPKFEKQEGQYTVVDMGTIDLRKKDTVNISLAIENDNNVSLNNVNGTLIVTGLKGYKGKKVEFNITNGQIDKKSGKVIGARILNKTTKTLGTLNDVLSGYQQFTLKLDGYIPVTKTVYVKKDTSSVTFKVKKVTSVSEFAPRVNIDFENSILDPVTGNMKFTGTVEERKNGQTKNTKFNVYVNDKPISATYNIDSNNKFVLKFKLPSGESKVEIYAVNDKGTTVSGPYYFVYNADFGGVKGSVNNVSSDDFVLVNVFDDKMNIVESDTVDNDGTFSLYLPVGDYYIQAVSYDAAGNVYYSNTDKITVKAGTTPKVQLSIDKTQSTISGAPSVSITSIPSEIDSDGNLTLEAQVSNFDFDNDLGDRFGVILNDMYYPASVNDFTKINDGVYKFKKTISNSQLNAGTNVVYIAAMNKNGEFTLTADYYIQVNKTVSLKTFNIEFIDDKSNTEAGYVYLDVLDPATGAVEYHYLSDVNDTDSYLNIQIPEGKYFAAVYDQDGIYMPVMLGINANNGTIGEIDQNGNIHPLTDADGDGYVDVKLKLYSAGDIDELPPLINEPGNNNLDVLANLINDPAKTKIYLNDNNTSLIIDSNVSGESIDTNLSYIVDVINDNGDNFYKGAVNGDLLTFTIPIDALASAYEIDLLAGQEGYEQFVTPIYNDNLYEVMNSYLEYLYSQNDDLPPIDNNSGNENATENNDTFPPNIPVDVTGEGTPDIQ